MRINSLNLNKTQNAFKLEVNDQDINKLSTSVRKHLQKEHSFKSSDSLEESAQKLAGPEMQKIYTTDPGADLSLAALARVVVAIISGRSMGPSQALSQIANSNITGQNLSNLLSIRKSYI